MTVSASGRSACTEYLYKHSMSAVPGQIDRCRSELTKRAWGRQGETVECQPIRTTITGTLGRGTTAQEQARYGISQGPKGLGINS